MAVRNGSLFLFLKTVAWVTYSDIIEFREKFLSTKFSFFLGKLSLSSTKRVQSHWNLEKMQPSNWWNIPLVRKRWNHKITGKTEQGYIQYLSENYLNEKSDLTMLSIGCGTGSQEIDFEKTGKFKKIIAIDIAKNNIEYAKTRSDNSIINFIHSSFENFKTDEQFDLILFHSSLHHLKNVNFVLKRVKNLLSENGILVIHEYCGPNRIIWNKEQIDFSNNLLSKLPDSKRVMISGKLKNKQSAPGKLRMIISDPSEAVDSESILNSLKNNFQTIELKGFGGNILVPVLKGISQNFIEETEENTQLLNNLFNSEDEFLKSHSDDYYFGIFKK